jgi:demethylmenaquinone methyltransferase/2-methoxy-6-polyprenyl-1,4-benzoquinol methylase
MGAHRNDGGHTSLTCREKTDGEFVLNPPFFYFLLRLARCFTIVAKNSFLIENQPPRPARISGAAAAMNPTTLESEQARARENQAMFARIAPRYDLMNRLMTAGMDVQWRRELIQHAELVPGARVLDIGTGTGDLAQEITARCPQCAAIASDYTFEMMNTGKRNGRALNFNAADALYLPFPANTFDAIVSGFLLRNVTDLERALREQFRILKNGGRWAALDTTRPEQNLFTPFIQFYLQRVIPALGKYIAGQGNAYSYLTRSTQNFLRAEELAQAAQRAGFREVGFARRNFGTIAIHWGKK